MQGDHVLSGRTLAQYASRRYGPDPQRLSLAVKLREPCHRRIYAGNLIPGGFPDNTVRRQIEDALKTGNGGSCTVAEHTGLIGDGRYGGIVAPDTVQIDLYGLDIKPGASGFKSGSRIGGDTAGDDIGLGYLDILGIVGS